MLSLSDRENSDFFCKLLSLTPFLSLALSLARARDLIMAGDDPQAEKTKPVVVILIGAPGSGKTTFCNDVMSAAVRPWVRVCQDVIANGKAGTKLQCLKTAAEALKDRKSVFIDRCNLEQEQRADFMKLGGRQAEVHAVVLDLPARLCISRSVKRTGHEGNLQGGKAAAVVNRMLQKKELPKLSEGFTRVTFCQNEKDVKQAVDTYIALGPFDSLPSGVFGQKSDDSKVQLGIMKFLKKIDVPKNAAPNENSSQTSGVKQEKEGDDPSSMELVKECDKNDEFRGKSVDDFRSQDDFHTLAFPSISTSDFQFNHEKASDIITEAVADFLNKVDNVRLVLVDLSHKSNILSLIRGKAAKKHIDTKRFLIHVGDITRLHTEGGLHCNVIANAANWRLKPGGGGVNAAIFKAAGEALEIATKQHAETLSPGNSVVIPLPSTSPLHQREGVTHVIHVLGPNMNPQRPNCLNDDYVQGCNILRNAYSSLFKNFVSISHRQKNKKGSDRNSKAGYSDTQRDLGKGTTLKNDQKAKREISHDYEKNKKCKGLDSKNEPMELDCAAGSTKSLDSSTFSANHDDKRNILSVSTSRLEENAHTDQKISEGVKRSWGSWAQALHQIAMHPEKHKDVIIEMSDEFVVLNDLYPKARKHVLVLSRANGLDSLADVRREHLPLLKAMHSAGLKLAEKFCTDDASLIFRLGYHSVPSMQQLHLHVISQDFDSLHLKNKKHWNSFNTAFFHDSVDVIEEIEKTGKVTLNDDEKLLSMELRCHRCKSAHPNIPRLKSHIVNCKASFQSSLLQHGKLVFACMKTTSGA
ncbi:putative Macro domain, HIT-like domain, histidine triad, aprataxin, HIT-like superfamily [Dioscorea sansibarensis]